MRFFGVLGKFGAETQNLSSIAVNLTLKFSVSNLSKASGLVKF
ncbi:hypothetical protein [uncultured Campylobacter sp.]|nr:hypothetical protein [uncultured Campylobacter sp.]